MRYLPFSYRLLFFTAPPASEFYTLSLHDALPISRGVAQLAPLSTSWPDMNLPLYSPTAPSAGEYNGKFMSGQLDRKSTRLNSSHMSISYAVFCLKKKNNTKHTQTNSRIPPHEPRS